MKKILFVMTMFLMAGTAMNAQKCTKAQKAECAKKGIACTKTDAKAETSVASYMVEADALAESSDAIKREECAKSGKVAYFEKAVCEKSGKVSWEEVQYCTKSKKFTKVASASMERVVETAEVEEAPKAAKKDAKKCCASKSGKKSCSKSKVAQEQ